MYHFTLSIICNLLVCRCPIKCHWHCLSTKLYFSHSSEPCSHPDRQHLHQLLVFLRFNSFSGSLQTLFLLVFCRIFSCPHQSSFGFPQHSFLFVLFPGTLINHCPSAISRVDNIGILQVNLILFAAYNCIPVQCFYCYPQLHCSCLLPELF